MTLKVLHITNLYPYQGNPIYGIFVKEQVDSLKRIGIDAEVFFINAQANGKGAYFSSISKIKKVSREYDLVHCHHSYSSYVAQALARVKKPVITSFLNVVGGEGHLGFIEKIINRTVVNKSAAIIVKNDSQIHLKYPHKGNYVPNGVNMDFFKPQARTEAFKKLNIEPGNYILFVSGGDKYRRQKRYDIFENVLQIMNEKYQANVKELCLVNSSRELVPCHFNAALLHLLPSDFEGSPNSVKESLACNRPVVATEVGNVKEMIGDVEGCYVSTSNDPHILAELTMKALEGQANFQGRSELQRKELDMESVAHQIEKIYHRVLENN